MSSNNKNDNFNVFALAGLLATFGILSTISVARASRGAAGREVQSAGGKLLDNMTAFFNRAPRAAMYQSFVRSTSTLHPKPKSDRSARPSEERPQGDGKIHEMSESDRAYIKNVADRQRFEDEEPWMTTKDVWDSDSKLDEENLRKLWESDSKRDDENLKKPGI